MRVVVLSLLLLCLSSSVFAIGMYIPDELKQEVRVSVGQEVTYTVNVRNDLNAKQVQAYVTGQNDFVRVDVSPSAVTSLTGYQQMNVVVKIRGVKNGMATLKIGLKDVSVQSGFGMQLLNEYEVVVKSGNGVNETTSSGGSSGRSGGGGGGGGTTTSSSSVSSSCDGKYVLQGGKWTCISSNASVVKPVAVPSSPPSSPPDAQMQDLGEGSSIMQGAVNEAVQSVPQVVGAAGTQVVDAVAKGRIHLVLIGGLAIVALASSLVAIWMMKGGSYA